VIFVAELGDESQLMALTFATRYRPLLVMVGIAIATALINAISVAVGYGLGLALPTRWISLAAGLVFIGFAIWTLARRRRTTRTCPQPALFAVFGIWLLIDALA